MTIAAERPATFGSGGAEPYARALRREGQLRLVRAEPASARAAAARARTLEAATTPFTPDDAFDVARWSADADRADLSTLADETGPVLDIGCGPARMVRAAQTLGMSVMGIDVSPTAVAMAVDAGLPVVAGSVFEPLPREGDWSLALLLDGNIGIGGDPGALLTRCAQIVAAHGSIVVETATDETTDESYEAHVVDELGHASATFPWAEIGREALYRHARDAGLRVSQTWSTDGRTFCRLVHRP